MWYVLFEVKLFQVVVDVEAVVRDLIGRSSPATTHDNAKELIISHINYCNAKRSLAKSMVMIDILDFHVMTEFEFYLRASCDFLVTSINLGLKPPLIILSLCMQKCMDYFLYSSIVFIIVFIYNLVAQDLPPKYEEVAEMPPQYNPTTMPPQYDPTTMPATVAMPPINNNTQGMHWILYGILLNRLLIPFFLP